MEIIPRKDLFDFAGEEIEREYKYRALIYPNITFQKDFSKDSFYVIMANILKHLTC